MEFSPFVVKTLYGVLGTIVTGVIAIIWNWLRKNFNELHASRKTIGDFQAELKNAHDEIRRSQLDIDQYNKGLSNKVEKSILDFKDIIREEISQLKGKFDEKAVDSSKELSEKIKETDERHAKVMVKIDGLVEQFDTKLRSAESSLKEHHLSKMEFYKVVASIKEDFFHQLMDIKAKSGNVPSMTPTADISKIMNISKKMVDLSKKVLEYDEKFKRYQAKILNMNSSMDEVKEQIEAKSQEEEALKEDIKLLSDLVVQNYQDSRAETSQIKKEIKEKDELLRKALKATINEVEDKNDKVLTSVKTIVKTESGVKVKEGSKKGLGKILKRD